jgi:hypothetical protein
MIQPQRRQFLLHRILSQADSNRAVAALFESRFVQEDSGPQHSRELDRDFEI